MGDFSRRSPVLPVFLVLVIAAGMTYYHAGIFLPFAMQRRAAKGLGGGYAFGNDFYPIWLTSRQSLMLHQDPYAAQTTREIQTGLFGRPMDPRNPDDPPVEYRAFAYPAYVDLLFWPLSLLSFPVVRVVVAAVLVGLTAASIPLWLTALRRRAGVDQILVLILLTLSSYAVLEGIFAVQPGLVVGFLMAASFAAINRGRLFLGGSLFALTFIKPQMSAAVAVFLVMWSVSEWRSRRAFCYGLLTWSGLLMAMSLIVWPHWIGQWLGVLSRYGRYSPPPLITYSLGPNLGPRLGPILIAVLLAAGLILAWKMRKVPSGSPFFMLTISLLLALTSITLLPGQAVYDHVVLLPGILLIAWTCQHVAATNLAFRVVLGVGSLALFWQWLIAIPLLFIRHLLSPAQLSSTTVVFLPFHAAASVPLAVSAILGLMMWRALRDGQFDGQALTATSPAESS